MGASVLLTEARRFPGARGPRGRSPRLDTPRIHTYTPWLYEWRRISVYKARNELPSRRGESSSRIFRQCCVVGLSLGSTLILKNDFAVGCWWRFSICFFLCMENERILPENCAIVSTSDVTKTQYLRSRIWYSVWNFKHIANSPRLWMNKHVYTKWIS